MPDIAFCDNKEDCDSGIDEARCLDNIYKYYSFSVKQFGIR